MKTLYLDIFSGLSGDMFIGALIDLGVDSHQLESGLRKLDLGGYHLHVRRAQKSSISGTKFDVHPEDEHHHHGAEHDHDHAEEHGHQHAHEHEHPHQHGHLVHSHAHTHTHAHGDKHDHEHEHAHHHDED